MLELAILGLLQGQPLHGYELKKRLAETLGSISGVSFGSLYPALRRLERAAAIEVVADDAAVATPAPPTGSLAGDLAAAKHRIRPRAGRRNRKAYGITDDGRRLFDELLSAEETAGSDAERSFSLRLAFCRYLSPERRLTLLERRRAQLVERLERAQRSAARPELDPWTASLLEHRARTTELDLDWIDGLVARERAGAPVRTKEPTP